MAAAMHRNQPKEKEAVLARVAGRAAVTGTAEAAAGMAAAVAAECGEAMNN